MNKNTARRLKEGTILFYSALRRSYLESCVQFWISQQKKPINKLKWAQQGQKDGQTLYQLLEEEGLRECGLFSLGKKALVDVTSLPVSTGRIITTCLVCLQCCVEGGKGNEQVWRRAVQTRHKEKLLPHEDRPAVKWVALRSVHSIRGSFQGQAEPWATWSDLISNQPVRGWTRHLLRPLPSWIIL